MGPDPCGRGGGGGDGGGGCQDGPGLINELITARVSTRVGCGGRLLAEDLRISAPLILLWAGLLTLKLKTDIAIFLKSINVINNSPVIDLCRVLGPTPA